MVARYRNELGLTASTLAKSSGLSRDVIANIESGRKNAVTVAELLTLSAALGVPPFALLVDVDDPFSLPIESLGRYGENNYRFIEWWRGEREVFTGEENKKEKASILFRRIAHKVGQAQNFTRLREYMKEIPFVAIELEGQDYVDQSTFEIRQLMGAEGNSKYRGKEIIEAVKGKAKSLYENMARLVAFLRDTKGLDITIPDSAFNIPSLSVVEDQAVKALTDPAYRKLLSDEVYTREHFNMVDNMRGNDWVAAMFKKPLDSDGEE